MIGEPTASIAEIVRGIYILTHRLEELKPGRHFTPDGHMVGSLGEVVAEERYQIELYEASHPAHDAFTTDGPRREVQIKTTQTSKIGISEQPDYLIVLRLDRTGEFEEIYNGPGKEPWEAAGKPQKNGQRSLSLYKLRELDSRVASEERISLRVD